MGINTQKTTEEYVYSKKILMVILFSLFSASVKIYLQQNYAIIHGVKYVKTSKTEIIERKIFRYLRKSQ